MRDANKVAWPMHADFADMAYSLQGAGCARFEAAEPGSAAAKGIFVAELPGGNGLSWE
ncbi:MAG TPA: hypothetical protein VKG82_03950 [Solirubrobacteraceae bacterium]|nr:hypothetical protein [Solirubrobacteraceae bacterium]HME04137.1 hypothetical protein [Solirubrobacteraceae bacterium]